MSNPREAVQQSMQNQFGGDFAVQEMGVTPTDLVARGDTLMQQKTKYSTAVQIVKPRNLQQVVNRCLEEAAIAGDDFYYSWSQGGKVIQGLSVGAAVAIARNFGNCVVEGSVNETYNTYLFEATFIDFETGFNLTRAFRQNKRPPVDKNGKPIYSGERGEDIVFQIGQSKAIRNVVLNAMPVWLVSKVLDKAKENVSGKIEKMGKENARVMLVQKAEALKIPIERIEAHYGKVKSWEIESLVKISGGIRAIENGHDNVDGVFPAVQEGQFTTKTGEKVEAKTGEIVTPQPKPEPKPEQKPAPKQEPEQAQDEPAIGTVEASEDELPFAKASPRKTKGQ